jgi:RimJ/RimL family protein N-acetyltransferase
MAVASFSKLWTPLAGSLIRLEPMAESHAEGLWEAARDTDWTWMPVDAGSSQTGFRAWLDWHLEAASGENVAPLVTVSIEDGRVLGSTHYHEIRPEHGRLEIGGTWLRRDVWQTGANSEAKLLQLEHVFSLGFQRVEFKTHPDNLRSRRALEALPARFEGILRKHLLIREGVPRDSAYYSVVDDEWPAVRANLERRVAARAPAHAG